MDKDEFGTLDGIRQCVVNKHGHSVMNQKINKCEESCNNIYSSRQSLWKHKQNCTSCMLFEKKKRSEMPNQHVQMKCRVCKKWMRKDNLKIHLNVHKNQLDLTEKEIKIEFKRRHDEKIEQRKVKRRQQQQKVIAIAENLNASSILPPAEELLSTAAAKDETLDRETLCREIEDENRRYIAKIELGKMISSILDEKSINKQSLNKEKQEALHLYRQQQQQPPQVVTILEEELRLLNNDNMHRNDDEQ